ncbi:hypothetical protein JCM8097_004796 [Rhodosporidiobolus ruineniae]
MVKVTSSLLIGAALVAPALAAPARFHPRATSDLAATDAEAPLKTEDVEAVKDTLANSAPISKRDCAGKPASEITSTERIRRNILLTPDSAADLTKRDLISDLGLAGTLAPLGLGDLLPTLTGAISGLAVVGEPVGGLVGTVDSTVGLTKLLQPKEASASTAAATKRDLLSTLTGTLGGTVGSLPVVGGAAGGLLNTASSTVGSTPLGSLLGQAQSSTQLQSLLGQLQALGLGNLPLSQLSQLTGAVSSSPAGSVFASTPAASSSSSSGSSTGSSGASTSSVPTSLMNQLSVAQAEQLGLLAAGTSRSLLATLQAEATNAATAATNAAGFGTSNAFKVAPHGFKASGNSTEDAYRAPANSTTTSTESGAAVTPTFAIASPEAVASAINSGNSFAATPAGDEDDSASEYSDDGESIFEEDGEDEDHQVGLEGQGPNASGTGAWNTASSTSSADQASATAEAMSLSYSDASATAVPTSTGNAKRWIQLD